MAECPVCGADITLEADAEKGEIIATGKNIEYERKWLESFFNE